MSHCRHQLVPQANPATVRGKRKTAQAMSSSTYASTYGLHLHVTGGVNSFSEQVEGPLNKGTVYLHMIQRPGEKEAEYQSLTLDVPGKQGASLTVAKLTATGHKRIFLEHDSPFKANSGKLFGVRWW